jgi:o-succinylbenzoate synthase
VNTPDGPETGLGLGSAHVYSLPMTERFRRITVRQGMLLQGPAGWGDFCPFAEYGDFASVPWLATALEAVTVGWPEPVRDRIPINVTVPAVPPERAHAIVASSDCRTAKVKVADHPDSLAEDLARVEAVRDALGPDGALRIDVNAVWDVDTALRWIPLLDRAAGGLEYVEQPCRTLEELAAVRRGVEVRIAADESIRQAEDPLRVAVSGAADIAVIKCSPLGGVRAALRVAQACGLPCVVSSALETSVGLSAQLALAGALPELQFACGLGTARLLSSDVVGPEERLLPRGGFLPVPRRAPVPDPGLLIEHTPPDAELVAWWHFRLQRVCGLLRAG